MAAAIGESYTGTGPYLDDTADIAYVRHRRSSYPFVQATEHTPSKAYPSAVSELLERNSLTEKVLCETVVKLNTAKALSPPKFIDFFMDLLATLRNSAKPLSKDEKVWRQDPHIYTIAPSYGEYHERACAIFGEYAEKAQYADGDFSLEQECVKIRHYSARELRQDPIVDPLLETFRNMGLVKAAHYIEISDQIKTEKGFKEIAKRIVELSRKEKENLEQTFTKGIGRLPNITVISPCQTTKKVKKESGNVDFWLGEMANLCQKALAWDKESSNEELEKIIAKLRYIFVHAAPLDQENELVGDWLEFAIYIAVGFNDVQHVGEKYVVYEALVNTLTGFYAIYPEVVKLGENRYRESASQATDDESPKC